MLSVTTVIYYELALFLEQKTHVDVENMEKTQTFHITHFLGQHLFVTGLRHRDKQPHTRTFTAMDNLKSVLMHANSIQREFNLESAHGLIYFDVSQQC